MTEVWDLGYDKLRATECNNQNRLSVRKVGSAYDVRLYAGKVIALRSRLASTTGLMQRTLKNNTYYLREDNEFCFITCGVRSGIVRFMRNTHLNFQLVKYL